VRKRNESKSSVQVQKKDRKRHARRGGGGGGGGGGGFFAIVRAGKMRLDTHVVV
jgi:hypothetical protein